MKVVAILLLALATANANYLQTVESDLSDAFDNLKGKSELMFIFCNLFIHTIDIL